MAITSLVLGIVGLVCWLLFPINFLLSPISALLGLIAIILGALAFKKPGENRGMCITGITTGGLSVLFFIGLLIIAGVVGATWFLAHFPSGLPFLY
jgi:hypothetical protein